MIVNFINGNDKIKNNLKDAIFFKETSKKPLKISAKKLFFFKKKTRNNSHA